MSDKAELIQLVILVNEYIKRVPFISTSCPVCPIHMEIDVNGIRKCC